MERAMMRLGEAAAAMRGQRVGEDVPFSGVSTDSRSLRAGELFVALRGERFDGHDFLDAVRAAGAAAVVIDRRHAQAAPLPAIVVDDTKLALGDLARDWRARFRPALIGVAGSNGKTTTKEMIAAILRSHAGEDQVLATAGNLNNEIGVPLTLLRLRAAHRYCAIELGMNHKGEIAYLAGIAQPTIAVVTNAQREHQEFMHSVDEVAEENAAVYRALPAEGVAVVNADDAHAGVFRAAAAPRRTIGFALDDGAPDSRAEVRGGYAVRPLGSEIRLRTPAGELNAQLAIPGLHNVRNALAAAACAHAAGIAPAAIRAGLEAFRPYTGRLQVKRAPNGATVIDDSYNANPDSVRAAIDVLASCQPPAVLVLGDMGEVGDQGPSFHREVGGYARSKGLSALLGIGEATRDAVEAFGANGVHAGSVEELVEHARKRAEPRATLLVKGSRFMRMERVVAALVGGATQGGGH
jgi:UDP-N-acetylmuramoyl-tripeptide--D-alanyl-D-alanine ligase